MCLRIAAPGLISASPLMTERQKKMATQNVVTAARHSLRRSLTLWHLIVIGIGIIQPIAAMGVYDVISNRAGGHVVTTVLIAMVAMLFTAVSYGRMARGCARARSGYTY